MDLGENMVCKEEMPCQLQETVIKWLVAFTMIAVKGTALHDLMVDSQMTPKERWWQLWELGKCDESFVPYPAAYPHRGQEYCCQK